MAFENTAIVGRDVTVFVSLTNSTAAPADNLFTELAATRGLEYGPEWATADTTARGTGLTRTSLVTYKDNNLSIDGLVLIDNEFQLDVADHIEFPPAAMNGQPYAWVRIVEPRAGGATRSTDYPVALSSFRKSAPYDGETTWTMAAVAQGEPEVTDIPAPAPPPVTP